MHHLEYSLTPPASPQRAGPQHSLPVWETMLMIGHTAPTDAASCATLGQALQLSILPRMPHPMPRLTSDHRLQLCYLLSLDLLAHRAPRLTSSISHSSGKRRPACRHLSQHGAEDGCTPCACPGKACTASQAQAFLTLLKESRSDMAAVCHWSREGGS